MEIHHAAVWLFYYLAEEGDQVSWHKELHCLSACAYGLCCILAVLVILRHLHQEQDLWMHFTESLVRLCQIELLCAHSSPKCARLQHGNMRSGRRR